MRRSLENLLHHMREAATLFWTNKISNILSLLSTTSVFLFLGLILIGWRTSTLWVSMIRAEAEIQVFVHQETLPGQIEAAAAPMRFMEGVERVTVITSEEARQRMTMLLGNESGLLSHLEENPFRPFLEVRISLDSLDDLLVKIEALPAVELVRDNRDVLDTLLRIETGLRAAGLVVGAAVCLFTLVLLSHITRIGVVHNREQIRTLRLLGAPEGHLSIPFFALGLLLGGGGGVIAAWLLRFGMRLLPLGSGSPIPFLPIPDLALLDKDLVLLLGGTGAALAFLGTLSGLVSARAHKHGHELP